MGTGSAAQDTKDVLLDVYPFPVFSNVYEALREARMRGLGWPPVLWIDAICIDQSNVTEKAAQIPFMREIYHLAASTCIYIPETPEDLKFMRFNNDLTRFPLVTNSDDWMIGSFSVTPDVEENFYFWARGIFIGSLSRIFLTAAFELSLKPVLVLLKILKNKCEDNKDNPRKPTDRKSRLVHRKMESMKALEPKEEYLQSVQSVNLAVMAQRFQDVFGSQTQYFNRNISGSYIQYRDLDTWWKL